MGTAVPAAFSAVLAPLRAALDSGGARGPFASVDWGRPDPDDGLWLALDDFTTTEGLAPVVARSAPDGERARLAEFWAFQNVCGAPLFAAGYLFAAQRRVPWLQGNVLLHNSEWLQHVRLLEPRLWVLPDDPLCGAEGVAVVPDLQALAATLLAEVYRTYAPIVRALRARRQTSTANAWGSVVDGLLQGFLLAGRGDGRLDAVWDLWHATIEGWGVESRRWPRRLQFDVDGEADEMVVRAACCLIWTIPDAAGAKTPNCPNCPLDIGDAGRVRWMVEWLRSLARND